MPFIQIVGPDTTPTYRFSVDGYLVPNIDGVQVDDGNAWKLILDRRFSITVPNQELERWLGFLAHAMAISAGYSAHGEHSRPRNPYNVLLMGIEDVETEEVAHDDE